MAEQSAEPVMAFCEFDSDCRWTYIGKTPLTTETAARWHSRATGHAVALYHEGIHIGLIEA